MTSLKHMTSSMVKPKWRYVKKLCRSPQRILDIGIANNSYYEALSIYPKATYHGVDILPPEGKMRHCDKFFKADLNKDPRMNFLGNGYDLIIANHVLEHLIEGEAVFGRLCDLLNTGGILYAEFPSIKTLYGNSLWPNMYHFHDDSTHRSVYVLEDLANIALRKGCKIIRCGPVSTFAKNVLAIPRYLALIIVGHKAAGSALVHLSGSVDHIIVFRQPD